MADIYITLEGYSILSIYTKYVYHKTLIIALDVTTVSP